MNSMGSHGASGPIGHAARPDIDPVPAYQTLPTPSTALRTGFSKKYKKNLPQLTVGHFVDKYGYKRRKPHQMGLSTRCLKKHHHRQAAPAGERCLRMEGRFVLANMNER